MQTPESSQGLIHSRVGAVIAVCCTGLITVLAFRGALSHVPFKRHWLIPLDSTSLPAPAVALVNVAFYAWVMWVSFGVYRGAKAYERVVLLGWCSVVLLNPFQALLSPRIAAALQWFKVAAMAAALTAAVIILLNPPTDTVLSRAAKRGPTIMLGIMMALAFMGLLLYWVL